MVIRLGLTELLALREEMGESIGEDSREVHQADALIRTMGRRAPESIGLVSRSSDALFEALVMRGYRDQT